MQCVDLLVFKFFNNFYHITCIICVGVLSICIISPLLAGLSNLNSEIALFSAMWNIFSVIVLILFYRLKNWANKFVLVINIIIYIVADIAAWKYWIDSNDMFRLMNLYLVLSVMIIIIFTEIMPILQTIC